MNKTQAIKHAYTFVSKTHRDSGTGYAFHGPFSAFEPNGHSTEYWFDSYTEALAARTVLIARIALYFMDRLNADSALEAESTRRYGGTVESCVDAGLLV